MEVGIGETGSAWWQVLAIGCDGVAGAEDRQWRRGEGEGRERLEGRGRREKEERSVNGKKEGSERR